MMAVGGVLVLGFVALILLTAQRQLASESDEAVVGPCAWILPTGLGIMGALLLWGSIQAVRAHPVEPPEYKKITRLP